MNEISWAIIGGVVVVTNAATFWVMRLRCQRKVAAVQSGFEDRLKDETESLQREYGTERDNAAKHFGKEISGLHDTLANERQAHADEITRIKESHAADIDHLVTAHKADVAAAYQRGKESDGMYRGNDGTGQMVSVKKAKEKAVAASVPKAAAVKQAGAKCDSTLKTKPKPKRAGCAASTKAPKTASS